MRFRTLFRPGCPLHKEKQKVQQSTTMQNTTATNNLSFDPSEYVNTYNHPAYGNMLITATNNTLYLHYGTSVLPRQTAALKPTTIFNNDMFQVADKQTIVSASTNVYIVTEQKV